jgi:hypothetical protein
MKRNGQKHQRQRPPLYSGHCRREAELVSSLVSAVNAGEAQVAAEYRRQLANHRRNCPVCSQRGR